MISMKKLFEELGHSGEIVVARVKAKNLDHPPNFGAVFEWRRIKLEDVLSVSTAQRNERETVILHYYDSGLATDMKIDTYEWFEAWTTPNGLDMYPDSVYLANSKETSDLAHITVPVAPEQWDAHNGTTPLKSNAWYPQVENEEVNQ